MILFKNATVVTLDDENNIFENYYLGVEDGKITYLSSKPPKGDISREIDAAGKVVMPALCNAHTHIAMTLLRGFADDKLSLQDWLFNYIFPAEEKLTAEAVLWGSKLAILEMVQSGTVSFTDMYFFVEETAKAVIESGMLANLSRPLQCFEKTYDKTTDYRYAEIQSLYDQFHGYDNGRLLIESSIHAEYTSIPDVWVAAVEIAKKLNIGINTHISETKKEHEDCIKKYGKTPTEIFYDYGVFGLKTTAAHCVWLSDNDIDIFAKTNATVVHNPVSNLKLRSGVMPLLKYRENGVNIALGTDSVASNNSHDLFEEIKLSALLHQSDDKNLGADGALRLATKGGFTAQGRQNTGEIIAGNEANLIMLNFNVPSLTPCNNPQSNLSYSAKGKDVCLTMARGKILYENGEFLTLDSERIIYESNKIAKIF